MAVSPPEKSTPSPLRSYKRGGGRASFLFPSWLSSHPGPSLQLLHRLRRSYLSLNLALRRLFLNATSHDKAITAHLSAILAELELRDFEDNPPTWQKNLMHQRRQNQLLCFEAILKAYDETQGPQKAQQMHPFPEIMLVMAKTLTESQHNHPELTQSASQLVAAHTRLSEQLFQQGTAWKQPQLHLEPSDPFMASLLEFRNAWSLFRQARLQQIRRQPTGDSQLAGTLPRGLALLDSGELGSL